MAHRGHQEVEIRQFVRLARRCTVLALVQPFVSTWRANSRLPRDVQHDRLHINDAQLHQNPTDEIRIPRARLFARCYSRRRDRRTERRPWWRHTVSFTCATRNALPVCASPKASIKTRLVDATRVPFPRYPRTQRDRDASLLRPPAERPPPQSLPHSAQIYRAFTPRLSPLAPPHSHPHSSATASGTAALTAAYGQQPSAQRPQARLCLIRGN